MDSRLPCLEVGASREEADVCVFLMHGLGADGHDFEDVAEALSRAAEPRRWRFVLPHAPAQPVTINMGMVMPAWYDIVSMDHPRDVNWDTVRDSTRAIESLMAREVAPRILLAGFSQGAAMALHVGLRHQASITGILMMSGYLLESEAHPCPEKAGEFPIGMFHGTADPVVPIYAAEEAVSILKEKGYAPSLNAYDGLEHAVSEDELRDVFAWLDGVCPPG